MKLEALRAKVTKQITAQKKANKHRDPTIFFAGDRVDLIQSDRLPTGNPVIDKMLGGGLPRGMIVEFRGTEGCGKTSAALMAAAETQERGGLVVWENHEGVFPYDAAEFFGVNINELVLIQYTPTAEDALNQVIKLIWDEDLDAPSRCIDLWITDSIAAFVPSQEANSIQKNGLAAMTVGAQARLTSKAWRYFTSTGLVDKIALLHINQLRTTISQSGMAGKTGTGGLAQRYYAKAVLEFFAPKDKIKKRKITKPIIGTVEETYGHEVRLTVVKNNTGLGDYTGNIDFYTVLYGVGIDKAEAILTQAVDANVIINTSPGRFELPLRDGEIEKVFGKDKVLNKLRNESEYYDFIEELIQSGDHKRVPIITEEDEETPEENELDSNSEDEYPDEDYSEDNE